ncbi:MAG: TrbG/VirB9 family P-type conjugative transfer protein [Gemmatimonadaceae bacterium]
MTAHHEITPRLQQLVVALTLTIATGARSALAQSPSGVTKPSNPAATTVGAARNALATVSDTERTSNDAVDAATRDFRKTGVARVVTEGNFVTFPFGHSQPTVTCARLRACIIELQPGEIVLSRIAGDLERWEIAPASAGADGRTTLVVVKPKDCDLTTNLVLATDRRIYDLTLDSPPCRSTPGHANTNPQDPYVRHVRFYYPDETIAQWTKPTPPRVAPSDLTQLNFNYEIKRDKQFPWQPAQVFDDGAHVYIKLPDAARHSEAPALFTIAGDGTRTLLNYSVLGDTYVTDRVFDRAELVAGVDGKERKVSLERRGGK